MKNFYFLQLPLTSDAACLPQAVGTIWSYCNQFKEVNTKYKLAGVWWKEKIDIVDPDFVAASCYMWNWKETYDILKEIKRKHPKCKIVVGGPEPQYTSEWLEKYPEVDAVLAYYGEETMRRLLVEDKFDIPGVVTRDFNNAADCMYADPKMIPSPYLNGFFDSLLENNTKPVRVIFEGNRGCPYTCSFCDIGHKKYTKIQMFETEKCLKELEWMCKRNVDCIDVADSNFGIFPRDEKLVDYVVSQKKLGVFNGRFMPTWAKTHGEKIMKLAKKLQDANVDDTFGFSLQSTNPETLDNVNRRNAFDIKSFKPIIKDLKDKGVSSYTELIFPLPGDSLETFKYGLHEIIDMPAPFDMIQINTLSRLSNTEFNTGFPEMIWQNIKGTAKPYNNDVIDEIAVATDKMTKDQVFEGFFYSRSFLIPMYWYGLTKYHADCYYEINGNRSELFKDIYSKLFKNKTFMKHKLDVREHYFKALNEYKDIGYKILNRDINYYTDTAYSHLFYTENNIFDVFKEMYPEYDEIIDRNKKDFRPIDDKMEWLRDIHVRGRFSESWRIK